MGYHKQSYPLDHVEIKAFSDLMQLEFTIYETTALRKMSEAYVIECNKTEPNTPMPYIEGERKKIPQSVLKAMFGIK